MSARMFKTLMVLACLWTAAVAAFAIWHGNHAPLDPNSGRVFVGKSGAIGEVAPQEDEGFVFVEGRLATPAEVQSENARRARSRRTALPLLGVLAILPPVGLVGLRRWRRPGAPARGSPR